MRTGWILMAHLGGFGIYSLNQNINLKRERGIGKYFI